MSGSNLMPVKKERYDVLCSAGYKIVVLGFLCVLLSLLVSAFGLVKQPVTQYMAVASVLVVIGGACLIHAAVDKTYKIPVVFFSSCALVLILNAAHVPVLSPLAKIIIRILFRDW